jgi:hypothetical protein
MIRLLIFLALAGAFAFCGATVKLGNRTFFGHVRAIWATDEVQDLKEGVQDKAKPVSKRIKKGVEAALEDEKGSGSAGSAAPVPKGP